MHGNDLHVAFYNRLPTGCLDLCRRQNRIIMFCPCLEIFIQYRIDPIFVFRNSYFAVVRCNGWRYSTKIGKEELSGLLKSGCTDSDIRQFIQKHPDIAGKDIWNYVSDYYAPEQCKGCKHVQLIGMYPCSCCSVNGTSKNYYEKRPL